MLAEGPLNQATAGLEDLVSVQRAVSTWARALPIASVHAAATARVDEIALEGALAAALRATLARFRRRARVARRAAAAAAAASAASAANSAASNAAAEFSPALVAAVADARAAARTLTRACLRQLAVDLVSDRGLVTALAKQQLSGPASTAALSGLLMRAMPRRDTASLCRWIVRKQSSGAAKALFKRSVAEAIGLEPALALFRLGRENAAAQGYDVLTGDVVEPAPEPTPEPTPEAAGGVVSAAWPTTSTGSACGPASPLLEGIRDDGSPQEGGVDAQPPPSVPLAAIVLQADAEARQRAWEEALDDDDDGDDNDGSIYGRRHHGGGNGGEEPLVLSARARLAAMREAEAAAGSMSDAATPSHRETLKAPSAAPAMEAAVTSSAATTAAGEGGALSPAARSDSRQQRMTTEAGITEPETDIEERCEAFAAGCGGFAEQTLEWQLTERERRAEAAALAADAVAVACAGAGESTGGDLDSPPPDTDSPVDEPLEALSLCLADALADDAAVAAAAASVTDADTHASTPQQSPPAMAGKPPSPLPGSPLLAEEGPPAQVHSPLPPALTGASGGLTWRGLVALCSCSNGACVACATAPPPPLPPPLPPRRAGSEGIDSETSMWLAPQHGSAG